MVIKKKLTIIQKTTYGNKKFTGNLSLKKTESKT